MSSSNGHVGHPRDVAHERALTATAAAATGRSHMALTELAEARALPGELREFLLRDWDQEGLDEGADWRNYICWGILRLDLSNRTDPHAREARAALHRALGHVVAAFEEQRLARRLLLSPSDRVEA